MFPKDDEKDKPLSVEQINLKRIRRARNLTQEALDAALHVKPGRTFSYERGKSQPPDDFLRKAAEALDLRDWRIFKKPLGAIVNLADDDEDQDEVRVPYWGVVPCGDWERPSGDPETVVVSNRLRGVSGIIAVRAAGKSMLPIYQPNDLVPIKLSSSKQDGAISLIRNEQNDLSLKIARLGRHGWTFESVNPEYGNVASAEVTLLGHAVFIPERFELEGVRL